MDIKEKFLLWQTDTLLSYNDNTKLVINEITKRLMIKKIMPKSEYEIHKALCSVNHKNIIKIYDAVLDGDKCIVLEQFVSGVTLEQFFKNKQSNFDESDEVINIIIQLCEGLEILHNNNIIHRDITPTNIMIDDCGIVKIIDFDISRSQNKTSKKDTQILGTEGYAAPEQFGFKQSTPQTDIYAVGVIINYITTGKMPTEAILNDSSILPYIIKKCIEFDPEKRYKNVRELLNDLYTYKYNTSDKIANEEKEETLLDKMIDCLPGVRSRYKVVRTFAFACYFSFTFFIYNAIQTAGNPHILLKNAVFGIFFLIIPFFFYTNYMSFQDKIFTKYKHTTKRTIFNFLATLSILAEIVIENML